MTDTFSESGQLPLWSDQQPQSMADPSSRDEQGGQGQLTRDEDEQWFFQFHENLLLTVQAVNRLHEALAVRIV
jgi:hypothetical protein